MPDHERLDQEAAEFLLRLTMAELIAAATLPYVPAMIAIGMALPAIEECLAVMEKSPTEIASVDGSSGHSDDD